PIEQSTEIDRILRDVKARTCTRVTRRSGRINQNHNRIAVAIERETDDLLRVTRRLTFVPEFVSRARPEPRLPGLDRARKTLLVHVGKREHLTGLRVLHDRRY